MLVPAQAAEVTVAHPVLGHPHVDIPVAVTAVATSVVVFVVALALPARRTAAPGPTLPPSSWTGHLSTPQVLVRALAVALLVVATAAGRVGLDDQLENLAPALLVGSALPLLVVGAVTLGPVWRWVDPWDAVARLLARGQRDQPPGHVWPAVGIALPLLWFFSAYPDPLDPRAVGLVAALYTIVTVTGCVALGRVRWLSSAEPVGLLLSWAGLVPRGRLADWQPPRGAEALLGLVTGGVLFAAVRTSEVWTGVNASPHALLWSTLAMAGLAALVALFFTGLRRIGQTPDAGYGVARAAVPVAVAVVLAVALERNRLFTSVQLLPGLLGDPFGRGWDLLGPAVQGLDPSPVGAAGLVTLQLGLLLMGHLVGAVVVARRLRDNARLPAVLLLLHVMGGSVVAVAMH